MNTEELIARVAQKDKHAFEQLYRQMRGKLVLQAKALLAGDIGAAEDAVDEAFADLWSKPASFSAAGSAEGWLRRIVRNKAIDHVRRSNKTNGQSPLDCAFQAPSLDRSPEESAIDQNSSHFLGQALKNLPGNQQEVLHLFYYVELSVQEIAEQIEVPIGTVKSRLFHGRQMLRDCVAPAYG